MKTNVRFTRFSLLTVMVLMQAGIQSGHAASGIWTGAANAVWTNNANWSSSTFPGISAGQTATFDGAGNGNTVLDLLGLSSIRYITFASGDVSAYTLGTGGLNAQSLILENSGKITLASGVVTTQRVEASLLLGTTTAEASYTFQNDSAGSTLVMAGHVAGVPSGGTPGTKTLNVAGVGDALISGSISDGGASSVTLVSKSLGTLTLAGANTYSGSTELYGGTLKVTHPGALGGIGRLLVRSPAPGALIELAHDGEAEIPFKIAMGFTNTGTLVSGTGTGGIGMNHTVSEIELGNVTMNFTRAENVVSGSPSITAQRLMMEGGGAYTSTLNPTTADLILGDVTVAVANYPKVINLDGTSVGNRVDGVISNGVSLVSLIKSNSGTWTLTGENVYTGATAVTGGTLALGGANGAVRDTLGITLSTGGTLMLDNTTAANTDRLSDTIPLTLKGGTLRFNHAGGAEDYSESAGEITVAYGANTVSAARADNGQTSALTFDSLAYVAGTIDFAGTNLGVDARNQILFATPPTLSGGIIGPWATVNGTNLATYGTFGITAYTPAYTDIAARGPDSVVPDNANSHVRIVADGENGPVSLAGDPTNRVAALTQNNSDWPATVDSASKTLLTGSLGIDPGAEALTLGTQVNSGTLSALSPDGVLSLINRSASLLTVNAAITDNGSATAVSKLGDGPVVLNGPCTHTGPTAINGGSLTISAQDFAQTLAGPIGGVGSLVKAGTNLLHLLAVNTYTGPTYINEGIVRVNTSETFGDTAAGGVFIADGATLDIGCSPDVGGTGSQDSLNLGPELFTVSGAGTDGKGVIVNNSNTRQLRAFGQIALASNAVFGGTADWRLRYNTPTLTLNDYTLTKVGTNMVELYSANVFPGKGHIDVAEGFFRILYDTQLKGGATNTLTVRSGAELELYQLASPQDWTLILKNGATVDAGSSGSATQNRWAGPVALDGEATLTGGSGFIADFQGAVSGTGKVTKAGDANVTLSGTNNTYTGATRITRGRVLATTLRNVGDASSLGQPTNAADGTIVIGTETTTGSALEYIGAGNTTDRIIKMGGNASIYHNGTGPITFTSDLQLEAGADKILAFRGDSAAPAVFAGALSSLGETDILFFKKDAGAWTLSGTNTFTKTLTVDAGTLTLAGSNTLSDTLEINAGSLLLTGTLAQGTGGAYVYGSTSGNSVLRLLPGSRMTGTGRITVGRESGTSGALYMEGGTLVRNPTEANSDLFAFGFNGGYGYLNVGGGSLTSTRLQLGTTASTAALGVGMTRITGGTCKIPNACLIGRYANSVGVLTIDGGTLDHSSATTFIQIGYDGGRGEINITGGDLLNDDREIEIGRNSENATGIVSLCAGSLSLNHFYRKTTSLGKVWLNFSGGTLRATADSGTYPFIPSNMDGVCSYGPFGGYAGGAVIDTTGKNVSVPRAIDAPAGDGVYAVNLSSQGSGYIGEPYVSLTGGGGAGVAAVANMTDDGSGNGTYKVGSVTITSPGVNFTEDPTVTFVRGGNGVVPATVASVTRLPNSSGGLTKLGAGILTLSAANTYTGTTTVAGGTLKLANAKALPTQTRLVLDGGTLDLNGYTVTNTVSGSGMISNGTMQAVLSPAGEGAIGTNTLTLAVTLRGIYRADVTAAGDSDRVIVTGNINLDALALEIVNPSQLDTHTQYTVLTCTGTRTGNFIPPSLPDSRWHLVYLADGTVKLIFVDGMMILLR